AFRAFTGGCNPLLRAVTGSEYSIVASSADSICVYSGLLYGKRLPARAGIFRGGRVEIPHPETGTSTPAYQPPTHPLRRAGYHGITHHTLCEPFRTCTECGVHGASLLPGVLRGLRGGATFF